MEIIITLHIGIILFLGVLMFLLYGTGTNEKLFYISFLSALFSQLLGITLCLFGIPQPILLAVGFILFTVWWSCKAIAPNSYSIQVKN